MISENLNKSVSLVIPVFNNQNTLIDQLNMCEESLKELKIKYEIIVCDDKSCDLTPKLLKKFYSQHNKFRLIFHNKNKGIAETIKELYHQSKFDYIMLFSVDGDWQTGDIYRLMSFALKNDADMVIGKRTNKKYSFYRKIISSAYNTLPYLLFGVKTFDAGSIKVFKKELILKNKLISKSVFFEAELIIRSVRSGKKVIYLPIKVNKKNDKGTGAKPKLLFLSIFDLIKLRLAI